MKVLDCWTAGQASPALLQNRQSKRTKITVKNTKQANRVRGLIEKARVLDSVVQQSSTPATSTTTESDI